MYGKGKKTLEPFAMRTGNELADFGRNQFWINFASVANSHEFDERGVLTMLEHKVNTLILFTKDGHDNLDSISKQFIKESEKFSGAYVNLDSPLVHIVTGINENNGLQITPASFANVKESDIPCIKLFIPVHQKIEDYPDSLDNFDADYLRIWTGLVTLKSDIEAITNDLNNSTKEMEAQHRSDLEENLDFLKGHEKTMQARIDEILQERKKEATSENNQDEIKRDL